MKNNTNLLVHIALAIALSAVLNFLPLWQMPQGGKVSLEMLPVLFIALKWGTVPGIITGLAYGFFQLMFDPHIIHPAQLILDYPAAYLFLGLSGLFSKKIRSCRKKRLFYWMASAVLLGVLGRFFSHLFSGVIFFSHYAPEGQNVWIYSIIYNASYLLPSMILCYIVLIPLTNKLIREQM
ncbi:MAG: energy-coupled thiamine transporter ThiT [Halanaerobiaceae bacterium]